MPHRRIGTAFALREAAASPGRDCARCPRLVALRTSLREAEPDWHNAPVPPFGDADAHLLIVGLAPGRQGANRTGRVFTGDYAGVLLFETLVRFGFAAGTYGAAADDGMHLRRAIICNAVRCLPPANRPLGAEINACRPYLTALIEMLVQLRAIVALGRLAHASVVKALGARQADFAFGHGRRHAIGGYALFDSYHCSRYNTNTGRLTPAMFTAVFASAHAAITSAMEGRTDERVAR